MWKIMPERLCALEKPPAALPVVGVAGKPRSRKKIENRRKSDIVFPAGVRVPARERKQP
jgi:hypothetical protein